MRLLFDHLNKWESFMEIGINPGVGFTPLHSAALRGHFEVWKFLCLNPEEKKPKNEEGFTPLHLAAENGHLDRCL